MYMTTQNIIYRYLIMTSHEEKESSSMKIEGGVKVKKLIFLISMI